MRGFGGQGPGRPTPDGGPGAGCGHPGSGRGRGRLVRTGEVTAYFLRIWKRLAKSSVQSGRSLVLIVREADLISGRSSNCGSRVSSIQVEEYFHHSSSVSS